MRRYLVVAHQTLSSPELRGVMKSRADEEDTVFHLLVPIYHGDSGLTWTMGTAQPLSTASATTTRRYATPHLARPRGPPRRGLAGNSRQHGRRRRVDAAAVSQPMTARRGRRSRLPANRRRT